MLAPVVPITLLEVGGRVWGRNQGFYSGLPSNDV